MGRMGRLSALVAVVLVACTVTNGTEKDGDSLKLGTNTEDARALMVKAFNAFSVDHYKKAGSATEGNVVLSPLSAGLLLALTWMGAGGVTARELGRALHLPQDERVVALGSKALVSSLQPPQNLSGNVVLRLANRLYAQKGLRLKKDFVEKARNYFEADALEVDFLNDQKAVRDAINQWVEEYTAGKIKDLLPDGLPDAKTRMVLVNAVYLKGGWLNLFDESQTKMRRFCLSSTSEFEVSTMFQKSRLNFANIQQFNATALELPVKESRLKMVIVLPYSVDGLPQLEAHLEHLNINDIPWRESRVAVYLPKFHIEATHDLVIQLNELGVQDMFTPTANLSRIAEENLYATNALQKTFIDVNELGVEAGAASAIVYSHAGSRTTFEANHPFLFFITNEEAILFLGRVKDPRQE